MCMKIGGGHCETKAKAPTEGNKETKPHCEEKKENKTCNKITNNYYCNTNHQHSCNNDHNHHNCSNSQLKNALGGGECQSKCFQAIQKFLQQLGLGQGAVGGAGQAYCGLPGIAPVGGYSNLLGQSLIPAVSQSLGAHNSLGQTTQPAYGYDSFSQAVSGAPASAPTQNIMNMIIGNNNTVANAQAA